MNRVVVDSNIVFSAILNTDSRIGQIILRSDGLYQFFAPEYLKTEIIFHKDKIMRLGQFDLSDFIEIYELILRSITVVSHSIVPINMYEQAEDLCRDIDVDDTVFVALSEYVDGYLWTGDKKLYKGLARKEYRRLVSTEKMYHDFITRKKRDQHKP